jgi:hypothetical protein
MANALEALAAGVVAHAPVRRHRLSLGAPPALVSFGARVSLHTTAHNLQGSRAAWPESPWPGWNPREGSTF